VVITRDHKIAMKGTGELITGRKVGFVLYGYDSCATASCPTTPDRLRLVIWDVANGAVPGNSEPVYDNRG
jgi:hypothetical protein